MKTLTQRLRVCLTLATLLVTSGQGAGVFAQTGAEAQIRERIASIRAAILARQPEGIVAWGTDDWAFTGPDGVAVDKAAYLVRARALMARVDAVDALTTDVDRLDVHGTTADVEITQHQERHERDAATGAVTHLRLRYREHHVWVLTADGWRVRRVTFIGTPERTVLNKAGR